MIKEYVVQANQGILDALISIYGSPEGMFDLINCNPELDITNPVLPDVLKYNDDEIIDQSVIEFFKKEGRYSINTI